MKILFFVNRDNGRDIEMIIPLKFYIEEVLQCEFKMAFLYDYHQIRLQKPDLVLVPNIPGSPNYYMIAKHAYQNNIKVFALDSEGHFRTDGTFNFWGHNTDKKFYQDYVTCWSNRTRDFLIQETNDAHKIVTTGGLGFDVYSIYQFKSRVTYLQEIQKDFKYIVGYAAWAFGKIHSPLGRKDLIAYFKGDETKLNLIEQQRYEIETLLRGAIESNPDTLFILKVHPLELKQVESGTIENEISNLLNYPNVQYEGGDTNIYDLINISDVWLNFESTTSIEGWALKKETILLQTNPNFSDSISEKKLDVSQPIASNVDELNGYISEIKTNGTISSFHDARQQDYRAQVVSESFGFKDGLNHIRAGYFLEKTLNKKIKGDVRYPFVFKFYILHVLIKIGLKFYPYRWFRTLPKVKKFAFVFEQYDFTRFYKNYKERKIQLTDFYLENGIFEKLKSGSFFKKIIDANDLDK